MIRVYLKRELPAYIRDVFFVAYPRAQLVLFRKKDQIYISDSRPFDPVQYYYSGRLIFFVPSISKHSKIITPALLALRYYRDITSKNFFQVPIESYIQPPRHRHIIRYYVKGKRYYTKYQYKGLLIKPLSTHVELPQIELSKEKRLRIDYKNMFLVQDADSLIGIDMRYFKPMEVLGILREINPIYGFYDISTHNTIRLYFKIRRLINHKRGLLQYV